MVSCILCGFVLLCYLFEGFLPPAMCVHLAVTCRSNQLLIYVGHVEVVFSHELMSPCRVHFRNNALKKWEFEKSRKIGFALSRGIFLSSSSV